MNTHERARRSSGIPGSRSAAALLAAALLSALPAAARSDLQDTVNRLRLQSCGRLGGAPLRSDPKLGQAVRHLSSGAPLRGALAAAGYLAAQSSVVHVSGAASDEQLSEVLAADYCKTLSDPAWTDMGVERRGNEVWLVLAAPARVPDPRDAPTILRQILDLVNRARASGRRCGGRYLAPAPALAENEPLTRAALAHSQDMAAHGEFDHRGHDGSSPALRIERNGYGAYAIVGENIAAGAMTPAEVVAGWLDSPAHCENILDPRFTEVGSGFAVNTESSELVYWTQDFAAPRARR